MAFEQIKDTQKKIIERYQLENWVKDEIINVLDTPLKVLPLLDQQQYTILINSAEHPEGYKLNLTDHPVLRIRNGYIVRDSEGKPDSFFWDSQTYLKNMNKYHYYCIGLEDEEQKANLIQLYNKMPDKKDGYQLFSKATFHDILEVIEMPALQRVGLEVTEELLKELPTLLESYNDWDESAQVELKVGDLLIHDLDGYYYRVEKSLKEQTYHKGTLEELFEVEVQ